MPAGGRRVRAQRESGIRRVSSRSRVEAEGRRSRTPSRRRGAGTAEPARARRGRSGREPRGWSPAARRVVVKVGSSSLTSAAGGLDAEPGRRARRRARRRAGAARVVLVSSGAIAAGIAPLGARPQAAGPGDAAGVRQRRTVAARRALRGELRALLACAWGRCCSRRGHHPAGALPQRPAHPRAAARPRRRAGAERERRRRDRGDPFQRKRPAGRAGRPPRSPPTCWCCSPTSTASTRRTRGAAAARRLRDVRAPETSPACSVRGASAGRASAPAGCRRRSTPPCSPPPRVSPAVIGAAPDLPAPAGRRGASGRCSCPRAAGLPLAAALARPCAPPERPAPPRCRRGDARCVERRSVAAAGRHHRGSRGLRGRRPGRAGRPGRARRSGAGWSPTTRRNCPPCSAAHTGGARPGVRPGGRPPRRPGPA